MVCYEREARGARKELSFERVPLSQACGEKAWKKREKEGEPEQTEGPSGTIWRMVENHRGAILAKRRMAATCSGEEP